MRRLIQTMAASVLAELAIDAGVAALADLAAPRLGDWVYVPAGLIIFATMPLLAANLIRVIRSERSRGPQCARGAYEIDAPACTPARRQPNR